jgi:predicted transcriptional regulator
MAGKPRPKVYRINLPIGLEVLMHISRLDGASTAEVAQRFNICRDTSNQCVQDLITQGFLMRIDGSRAGTKGGQRIEYKITKEGINELTRIRTLLENSLRVRRSSVVSIDPEFVKN